MNTQIALEERHSGSIVVLNKTSVIKLNKESEYVRRIIHFVRVILYIFMTLHIKLSVIRYIHVYMTISNSYAIKLRLAIQGH